MSDKCLSVPHQCTRCSVRRHNECDVEVQQTVAGDITTQSSMTCQYCSNHPHEVCTTIPFVCVPCTCSHRSALAERERDEGNHTLTSLAKPVRSMRGQHGLPPRCLGSPPLKGDEKATARTHVANGKAIVHAGIACATIQSSSAPRS